MFGIKSKLGKVSRIVALVAAMSSACSSRNEPQFLELVDKKDKPAAAQIIHEGKRDFNAINAAFLRIQEGSAHYEQAIIGAVDRNGHSLEMVQHYRMITLYLREILHSEALGYHEERQFMTELRTLEQAGLAATAQKLKKNFLNLHINLDFVMAKNIRDAINRIIPMLRNNSRLKQINSLKPSATTITYEVNQAYGVLGQIQTQARKSKYGQTAQAVSDALGKLKAAWPKIN